MVQLKEGMRAICRRGWSPSRSDVDQSAGEKGGAVLPKAKKRCSEAVARAGQTVLSSAAGFRLRQQAKEGKRDALNA